MSPATSAAAAPRAISLAEALQRAQREAGDADFSALSAQPFLLLHTDSQRLGEAEQQLISGWLQGLPCAVLGIALDSDESLIARSCDVLLRDTLDAALLAANIRRTPIAATVLVQLLRAIGRLSPEQALTAESLAYSTLQAGPEFKQWLEQRPREHSQLLLEQGPAVSIERQGSRLNLRLNRPEQRNAMSVEMRDALVEALRLVQADRSIERVVLSASGRCFSTGGELAEFGTAPDPATAHIVRSLSLPGRLLAACADLVEVRVHGACIGSGIEFPAFAGRVVATEDAWFQLPELRYGLIPGAGGCSSIARRIGRQRTAWLALSGKRIDARTALGWGLIDDIVVVDAAYATDASG